MNLSNQKSDYWLWENKIPMKKIKDINSKIKNLNSFGQDSPASSFKNAKVKVIEYSDIENYLHPYIKNIYSINEQVFGYNVYPPFFFTCNYNTYDAKQKSEYDWHVDESHNHVFDIKLTALFNLSEKKYKGGEFSLFKNKNTIVQNFNKPGDILLFKSYISHKVNPVLKGIRNTLTIFLTGPKFI
jgi:PKHD-type hydroxylase